jgi:hypothetical protein
MVNRASAWSLEVDPDLRVCSMEMSGVVTAPDIFAAQTALAAHTRFDPSFGLIVDLNLVTELPLTWVSARMIVKRSPVALNAPRAFVATTITATAMAYAYRALRERITVTRVVHVCRSMGEAREWICTVCGRQSQ